MSHNKDQSKRLNRRQRRQAEQLELMDLNKLTLQMVGIFLDLVGGDEVDQRLALDRVFDLMASDIRLAKRAVDILDYDPRLKDRIGHEFYERAVRMSRPR